MSYIHAENLVKQYGTADAAVMAVGGMSFRIKMGEFVVVMGESGSGKSTLLSMMGALNTPTSGEYSVDGLEVYKLGQDQRADFRREFLGFVFQSFHLVPYLTLLENVMLPLATVKMSSKKKRALAEDALLRVGLNGKSHRLPGQTSGGEQERVAIARAIVNEPPILFADEPSGNLDTKTTREVMDLLKNLNEEGMTIVMVTHSPECASYTRRMLRISDGLLVEDVPLNGSKGGIQAIVC
ncbi:MAG: ABC transporter ATP-binding protein [Deltaproteobacteria bacterium]|jgi:putative ABC transport system ATP-binding protein|nr:ABC transporter ATP-binding protein [Deltaproteobacteria bacterium]PNV85350.1 MAG: ABC transporter ATP-binding protein [Desulfobacteraceae bacterium]MDH3773898.1 ABC transporter ATP-binding protein [Deltaproteobacteria bacterium]MDH3801240.1 ABC transporter ATP-binding protein [Deltaproteobacteria bacterium]MDH3850793.1 ABC transporter ATP-binding protein [Deltaproteobacteria bacterium]